MWLIDSRSLYGTFNDSHQKASRRHACSGIREGAQLVQIGFGWIAFAHDSIGAIVSWPGGSTA